MNKSSIVLGIDTSCDETSLSLFESGKGVLANTIYSQTEIHRAYGGVVPEMASRSHLEKIPLLLEECLDSASVKLSSLSGIAVTSAPGLVGCLLVGLSFAKSLTFSLGVPLTAVHHLKGHLMSAFLEHNEQYPFLGLVVSGGHTALYYVKSFNEIDLIGISVDDAVGEAYDKVAKLLGIGYPGGPLVDKLAQVGNPQAFSFTRARVKKGKYFFSFSGLKTAVAQIIRQNQNNNDAAFKQNLCASFQREAVDSLLEKVTWALREYPAKAIVVAGGVACNSKLRHSMNLLAEQNNLPLLIPSPVYCTDNAAMIAYVGSKQLAQNRVASLDLNAQASVSLDDFYNRRIEGVV